MRVWRLTILLIGCGRVAFDAPHDAPSPDGVSSLADRLPCDTPFALDGGGHLAHDVLAWVNDAQGDWLVGVAHMSQDMHQIERHAITLAPSGPAAGPDALVLAVDHVDVLSFEPVAGGYVLGYNEFVLQTGHALLLTPDMVKVAAQPLGMLASGNPPLARAGKGGLAMIGLTSNDLQVIGLRDDGSPTGIMNHLATPAEGAALPTMIALDDGLAVIWHSNARGTCRLATLNADLSLAHGPVDMAVPGCSDAHVAWLPGPRRLIAVADSDAGIAVAVWDENLAPLGAPAALAAGGHWARIIADGDTPRVAWAEASTAQKLREARLSLDGKLVTMGAAVGQLDDTLGHFHTLQHVGGSIVALWTDAAQSRTFTAMRLCL